MNNYQININKLEQRLLELKEEKEQLENSKKDLTEEIKRIEEKIDHLERLTEVSKDRLFICKKDVPKIVAEDLKLAMKIQGMGAVFATALHILAIPLLISGAEITPEQASSFFNDYPAYYLNNMKEFFAIFLPLTLIGEALLNVDTTILIKKLRQGKIDLEAVELSIYNYEEQLKGAKGELALAKENLLNIENSLEENNQEEHNTRKEQTNLIKEKNILYSHLVDKYLATAIEEDLNQIYIEKHTNKQLKKHPAEVSKQN